MVITSQWAHITKNLSLCLDQTVSHSLRAISRKKKKKTEQPTHTGRQEEGEMAW